MDINASGIALFDQQVDDMLRRSIAETLPVLLLVLGNPVAPYLSNEVLRCVELQGGFVKVEVEPGEATVAEAGGMMCMEDGIEMETVFGDGSQQQSGFVGALIGAGKRLLVGESLFMTVFLNKSSQKKRVAFGAPYPGKIVPVHLAEIGGELIAQKDSFLAAAKGVSIGIAFQRRLGVGLFGGEGFIMERLQGNGWAFVHAGGMLTERTLAPGELLRVETGCIVAFPATVNYDIQFRVRINSALF